MLHIYVDTETELEEDVLEELLNEKPNLMLTVKDQNEGILSCTGLVGIVVWMPPLISPYSFRYMVELLHRYCVAVEPLK